MAQLLIDIPDDLAQRLAPFQNQLSELFSRLIETTLPKAQSYPSVLNIDPATIDLATEVSPVYLEVLDFLVTRPTSEQLLTFKVSDTSQERLEGLLDKNRNAMLNPSETAELDMYEQLDTLMTLLKIRAYAATHDRPQSF